MAGFAGLGESDDLHVTTVAKRLHVLQAPCKKVP
jgi:hypothetical protein